MSTSDLFAPNSTLFKIVPLLAEGLFYYESLTQLLLALAESDPDLIQRIEGATGVESKLLAVDEDKSVMLSLIMGKLFVEAFEMLVDTTIEFEVCSNTDNKDEEVRKYLAGDFDSKVPVLVTARQRAPGSRSASEDEPLELLRRRILLSELDKLEYGHRPNEILHSEDFLVDLKSWYCSCDEYQDQIAGTSKNHPEEYREENGAALQTMDEIMQHSTPLKMLSTILTSTKIPTRHKSPLPLCSHLLALVLCSYNKQIALYTIK